MRKTTTLVLAVVLMAASLSSSAQAVEAGTINGTFTDRAGAPMSGVSVELDSYSFSPPLHVYTTTDANGHYTFPGLAAANDYRVRFSPLGYPSQYAYQTGDSNAAARFTVGAGTVSVVDDQLMPTGTVTGRLTYSNGTGVSGVSLYLSGGPSYTSATTDPGGYYSARVHPGIYRLSFSVPGGGWLTQYVPGTDVQSESGQYPVAADETIIVNDTVMPTGYLTGKFTDAGGSPIQGVSVHPSRVSGGGNYVTTDAAGNYSARVKAGTYRVRFDSWSSTVSVHQWAVSKVQESDAAQFAVGDGQTVTVNDSRMATGSVRVTAVDAVTGEAINYFWAWLTPGAGVDDGNDRDGVSVLSQVPVGTYHVTVQAPGYVTQEDGGVVTVQIGQEASIEVTMPRKTRIDATVVDAQTGLPVAGVCLIAGQVDHFNTPDGCGGQETGTDGKGMVEIYNDKPGEYQLLAFPSGAAAHGYGAQWVGPSGGTGSQTEAKNLTVQAGQAIDAGIIRMDRAGTITGHVTPSAGSPALQYGYVVFADGSWRAGGGFGFATIDETGSYTIDYLGPYQWPLRFAADAEAPQWSGGQGNRYQADRIQVTAGASTTYNYQFRESTIVDLRVPATQSGCEIDAFNSATGDLVGRAWAPNCVTTGAPLRVVAGQSIKLFFMYDTGGTYRDVWHGGTNFASAVGVSINGPMTLTLYPGAFTVPRVDLPVNPDPTPVPVPRPTVTPSGPPVPRL